ncbi:MAG: nucleoside triphosphate pyrophosphohydrolase [Dehalococcoidia bacterium]|nr:nucleoside triphosphate pyrophosphohydrolase [Dehalococcoidia bacterium]
MPLTIVGLGPGATGLLTIEARGTLARAEDLYFRTLKHPVVEGLLAGRTAQSFDEVYDSELTFAGVYEEIARRLIEASASTDVTYAVPGHPNIGEATVRLLIENGIDARIVAGVSYIEPACTLLNLDPMESGLQMADALAIGALDPSHPALVAQAYSRRAASELKLSLLRWYPAEHDVTVLHDLSLPAARMRSVPLQRLDHDDDFDHLSSVFIPAVPPEANFRTIGGLRSIVARLRAPDGCPWDREQTHTSLKSDLLEETYEVLAALDANRPDRLAEELGDLLNQVMLHSQIAEEEGEFELEDVLEAIASKLVRRHPHVFAGLEVSGTEEVLRNWEKIKSGERDGAERPSALSGVPTSLPALHQASAVLERASRAGFRWPRVEDIFDKLTEEVAELRAAQTPEERRDEFGDILFNLANAGRYLDMNAEDALRAAVEKFRKRYTRLEDLARERALDFQTMKREELMALWNEAKTIERGESPGVS